jgi:hypothetical protein
MGNSSERADGAASLDDHRLPTPPRIPSVAPDDGGHVSDALPRPSGGVHPDGHAVAALSETAAADEIAEAGPTTAVTPSQRTISISLTPSPTSEHPFWDTPPKYSLPPPSFVSEPPRPKPSRARSLTSKLLFVVVFFCAATLLGYAVSIEYHVPWLDPRWLLARLRLG